MSEDPNYLPLKIDERIQVGDEFLNDEGGWEIIERGWPIGARWNPYVFVPLRRLKEGGIRSNVTPAFLRPRESRVGWR